MLSERRHAVTSMSARGAGALTDGQRELLDRTGLVSGSALWLSMKIRSRRIEAIRQAVEACSRLAFRYEYTAAEQSLDLAITEDELAVSFLNAWRALTALGQKDPARALGLLRKAGQV